MMKLLKLGACACLVAFLFSCSGGNGPAALDPGADSELRGLATQIGTDPLYRRYIVVLQPGTTDAVRDSLAAGLSRKPDHFYSTVYKGFAGELTAAEVQTFTGDNRVRMISKDQVRYIVDAAQNLGNPLLADWPGASLFLGADADYSVTRATSAPQVTDWGVTRIKADLNAGPRGSGVGVAILDTGCDMQHPDLFGAFVGNYNGQYTARAADDGHGHGSHVAGIIGARDNAFGIVGVAPNCNLLAVKVLSDRGWGLDSWIVGGIDWCAANKATYNIKVANMSLGGGGYSSAEDLAITTATDTFGVTFAVAAGNSYANAAGFSPAQFNRVICVSALDRGPFPYSDYFATYSNYGTTVEVIAPGTGIFSTYRKGRYATLSGTSMATPHVAGACALWFDNHPADTRDQCLSALVGTGYVFGPGGWPTVPGQGRPDPDGVTEPLIITDTL
jgi:subtilisin family serine protease